MNPTRHINLNFTLRVWSVLWLGLGLSASSALGQQAKNQLVGVKLTLGGIGTSGLPFQDELERLK